ncbi:hypothetical protein [Actinophytocola sediminis]
MTWQEQRRLNDAAKAEQARQDRVAAAQVEAIRTQTQVDAARAMGEQRDAAERAHRADQEQRNTEARVRRAARRARLLGWCGAHVVDLLIYPLAVVSAVMAVPAMAAFGHEVYGTAAGYALPIITELGMWAFAIAVHLVRHRNAQDGGDRPVWALQLGVWSFATVAAGLNFLHGAVTGPLGAGVTAGVVMAVASVAGVAAHQLVTAAPRRSRVARHTARIQRRTAATVTRVRRAALRATVADIDQTGEPRLLFRPGQYRLTRSRLAPWRAPRLAPISTPDPQDMPSRELDALDHELAALLNTVDPYPAAGSTRATEDAGGGIGTLDHPNRDTGPDSDRGADRPAGQRKSTRSNRATSDRKTPRSARREAKREPSRAARSIEDLRTELYAAIEADPSSIDPTSAESIRRALHCSPTRARELRDSYRPNH